MPVTIRELVIKTTIGQEGTPASGGDSGSGGGKTDPNLVQTCVNEVIRILEENKDR